MLLSQQSKMSRGRSHIKRPLSLCKMSMTTSSTTNLRSSLRMSLEPVSRSFPESNRGLLPYASANFDISQLGSLQGREVLLRQAQNIGAGDAAAEETYSQKIDKVTVSSLRHLVWCLLSAKSPANERKTRRELPQDCGSSNIQELERNCPELQELCSRFETCFIIPSFIHQIV